MAANLRFQGFLSNLACPDPDAPAVLLLRPPNVPTHRVFVGRAEIGACWAKTSAAQRDYLSVKLDGPSFTAPIFANLFDDEEGDGYSLIWSRPSRAND